MALRRVARGGPLPRTGSSRYSPVGIILALLVAVVLAMLLTRVL